MHFSKDYAQLLVTLPPEFRTNAFEYRKLKQLINRTVSELDSLGLDPSVLRSLHGQEHVEDTDFKDQDETLTVEPNSSALHASRQDTDKVVYEIVLNASALEPRLRLSPRYPSVVDAHHDSTSTTQLVHHVDLIIPDQLLCRITETLLHPNTITLDEARSLDHSDDLIIPLPSDMAFFQLLTSSLSSLSGHLATLQDDFYSALTSLAASISLTARPASSSAPNSFSAYSLSADNSTTLRPSPGGKTDLYTWREIFRLYIEAEIFEGIRESSRGERSIEEAVKHLELFKTHIQGQKASLVLAGSSEAFDAFLNLNSFIMDMKKFQRANSEATRKILKKHAKRTMLPIPSYLLGRDASLFTSSRQTALIARPSTSLPRLLVQSISEVLLPIVPHIDDYACLICTLIAFKPIRLSCGHFFCVRCLVKLQRRQMPNCPMCRAPTVLQANPSNLDYGLLNFMADWFPIESLEKLHANEQEVTQEQLEALGMADVHACRLM